jgi:hypothetical protein
LRKNAERLAVATAAIEAAATGLFLLISPVLFGRLVLGAELSEPGQALGRLGGIALLGFAMTSWPEPVPSVARALLAYNVFATAYLCWLGFTGSSIGILLWPAIAVHVLLALFLASCRAAMR